MFTAWVLFFQLTVPRDVRGGDGERQNDSREHRLWIDYYKQAAQAYRFRFLAGSDMEFKMAAEPILKFNQETGLQGTHGTMFVWTHLGRPEVIGSIWSYEIGGGRRSVVHEFHSLSLETFQEVQVGAYSWHPRQAGIELKVLADAPPPASDGRLRLIQMRSIARGFAGYGSPVDKEISLRLHPQPLYRYESQSPDLTDGALFGFFNEWDPEIMLVLEARNSESGPRWHYAAARFNICPLRLDLAGESVWRVETGPQQDSRFGDPSGGFFAVHGVDVRPVLFGASPNENP